MRAFLSPSSVSFSPLVCVSTHTFLLCVPTSALVTIEDHPHLPGKHASVHPCRHGAVMKKIIDVLISRGVEPEVDKYLFLFLKFIASVVPTIEYDYTMDFDLGSSSH
ncbi:hypothetical protein ZIOFF_028633 [Zingiber officinale]|uniref:Uncharacterized protein n=1 Tax=Zingiber officinale TaxID=94328 RepID=A0A8J5GSC3_ZINOF|nr:hypothetical protein ZIOFF_028633 [Zingiber officinale]